MLFYEEHYAEKENSFLLILLSVIILAAVAWKSLLPLPAILTIILLCLFGGIIYSFRLGSVRITSDQITLLGGKSLTTIPIQTMTTAQLAERRQRQFFLPGTMQQITGAIRIVQLCLPTLFSLTRGVMLTLTNGTQLFIPSGHAEGCLKAVEDARKIHTTSFK